MGKVKANTTQTSGRTRRPATTPEARENQLIALAMDAAEEQLINGTASSQVIVHFLKMGCSKAELEREKLENENLLLRTKAKSIESADKNQELYQKALRAFSTYRGEMSNDEPEDIQ